MRFRCTLAAVAWILVAIVSSDAAPRYLANVWQSEDGLPRNSIRAIAQASDGYLWIGTAEGLTRFDGVRFSGFPEDVRLARREMRALFALANGDVWVTTASHELLRGKGTRLEEVLLPARAGRSQANLISQVVLGENGDVFIMRGAELWKYRDGKIARVEERTATVEMLLQQDAAAEPERGRVLENHDQSVVRLRDTRGQLWQFKPGAELTVTDSAGHTESLSPQMASPSIVQAMLEDLEGNLWLGTHSQGLWRVHASRVDLLAKSDELSDQAVRLTLEDHTGALWAAPQTGGLDRVDGNTVTHFDVGSRKLRDVVSALLETGAGVFWAATRDHAVYLMKNGQFSPALPADQTVNRIVAMAEDGVGRIWLGGGDGLSVWDGVTRRKIDLGGSEAVTALHSSGSTIWAGTESGKVFRGEGESFVSVASADGFARNPISSLLPDAGGSLWIATMGGGLFRLHEGHVLALAPRMGEVDSRITCLIDDHAGFLWMGTMGGICRADKAALLGEVSPAGGSILVLDRSDGLLTREVAFGHPSGWRGHDGTLYFSTGKGVAVVDPDRISINTKPPPVLIEEASADGQPLMRDADRMRAGPGRSRLEFRYTALSFTAPEKVRFRTKLEGLDDTWREAGDRRTVAYEAVPPGRYVFHVKARNGDGVWNETGAALAVDVRPHFWETRWFQVAFALTAAALAVAAGALIMRARLRGRLLRLEAHNARETERARIARDMHDELGASLTRIALMSDLASFEPDGNGATRSRFGDIAKQARSVSSTLDRIVWTVNPRNDTIERLVGYLGEFATEYLETAGVPLALHLPSKASAVPISSEVRHNVLLGVKEALNNIVKYAHASAVEFQVTLERENLCIMITDDGCGFDPSTVSVESNGLRNMQQRFAALGGTARIESRPGTGTIVTFHIRLG